MKIKVFQALIGVPVICFLTLMAGLLPADSFAADDSQNFVIQNATIQPGDVINFQNGPFTYLGSNLDYGHTGLYLGRVNGEPAFMDFTTRKDNAKNDEYHGRISNAAKFLSDNLGHGEFNVYRLNGDYDMDRDKLVAKAQEIARDSTWQLWNNCAQNTAKALSAALPPEAAVKVLQPDDDTNLEQFVPVSLSINIKEALKETQKVPTQVSGTWYGTYSYDDPKRAGEVGKFTMKITQGNSRIYGVISEPNILGVPGKSTLFANFSGTFDAGTMKINFTKTYRYDTHEVSYNGVVNGSGGMQTAAGRWQIGSRSGSWKMNR